MLRKHKFLIINFLLFILVIINIIFINVSTSDKIIDYSTILASKITKYVVTSVYQESIFNLEEHPIYEIIKDSKGEIKTINYNTEEVNNLLSKISDRVYAMFDKLESGDIKKLSIRENILTNKENNYENGIILEIPSGIILNNFLFSSLGPKIPVRISLTGELESCISTKVEEYGLNNALISIYVDIKVTEQVLLPFRTEKIIVENKLPIAMNLINGEIPNYYLSGFDKNSNIYKTQ